MMGHDPTMYWVFVQGEIDVTRWATIQIVGGGIVSLVVYAIAWFVNRNKEVK